MFGLFSLYTKELLKPKNRVTKKKHSIYKATVV